MKNCLALFAMGVFFTASSTWACTRPDCGYDPGQTQTQQQAQAQSQNQSLSNEVSVGVGVGVGIENNPTINSPSSANANVQNNPTINNPSSASANNEGVTQKTEVTVMGGEGGKGGASSSTSKASVGDILTSVTLNEAKQYPVPGEINQPGLLQTPNNDKPGPYYYDPNEVLFVKFVFTLEELEVMAEGASPDIMGDLLKKKELPREQWSPRIAFYLEIPQGVSKSSIQQVGMMTLDSESKKIDTPKLFGVAGRETAKRGANAVMITGDGYQREDKAFSFGPGASMTGPSGSTISTVALPFIYAKRWKDDQPWLHATAVNMPLM